MDAVQRLDGNSGVFYAGGSISDEYDTVAGGESRKCRRNCDCGYFSAGDEEGA